MKMIECSPSFAAALVDLKTSLDVIKEREALDDIEKILSMQAALLPCQWLEKTVSIIYEPEEMPGQRLACVLLKPQSRMKARKICRLLAPYLESQVGTQTKVPEDLVVYHDSFQDGRDHLFHQEKNGIILLSFDERVTIESIEKNSKEESSSLFSPSIKSRKDKLNIAMTIDGRYLTLPSSGECMDAFSLHNTARKLFQQIERIDYEARIVDQRIVDLVTIQLKRKMDLPQNMSASFNIDSEDHLLRFIPDQFSTASFIDVHDKKLVFGTMKRFASFLFSGENDREELIRTLFEAAHAKIEELLDSTGDLYGIVLGVKSEDPCSFLLLFPLRNKNMFTKEIEPFLRIVSTFGYIDYHTYSGTDIASFTLPFRDRVILLSIALSGDTLLIASSWSLLKEAIDMDRKTNQMIHSMQPTSEAWTILNISNMENFKEPWNLSHEILSAQPVSMSPIIFNGGVIVCRGDGQFGSLPAFLSFYSFFFPSESREEEVQKKW